jgi:endo-1,4-beta-xylanase
MSSEFTVQVVDNRRRPLADLYIGSLRFSTLDYEVLRNSVLSISASPGCVTMTPPLEPFQVGMVLPVEGFGSVYAYADNGGEGFTGAEKEIDFTFEAARTRVARVRRWIGEQTPGFRVSSAGEERLGKAEDFLQKAQKAPLVSEARHLAALASLREGLWAGEVAVLEKARSDIARRAPREGFLFGGGNLVARPASRRKRELFTGLFNLASVVLHWRIFEPRRGEKAWARVDDLVDWLNENRITAKGHPLLWPSGTASPEWVLKDTYQRNYEAYTEVVLDRVYDIVKHYQGTLDMYDVANEAHDCANVYGYSPEQLVELTGLACDVAREANAEVIRVINTYLEWGQYVAIDSYHSLEGLCKSARPLMSVSKYLEKCVEASIGFEAIGLQVHNPVHDMFEISLMFDRYARFGKPIHITELGVPSAPIAAEALGGDTNVGDYAAVARAGVNLWGHPHYWHEPYNEDVQADWYEQFYTLCYSKPYITAVTNWLWEDCGTSMGLMTLMARARGERPRGWPPHTGFVKSDLTPKQSYYRIKKLIESWRPQQCQ